MGDEFVLEGIRRYGPAQETLGAFEAALQQRLEALADEYESTAFKPAKRAAKRWRTGHGSYGHIVRVYKQGRLCGGPGKVWMELGMWWLRGEAAYYCGFLDANDKPIPMTYKGTNARVKPRLWSTWPRLFMCVAHDTPAFEPEMRMLLDELSASFE